MKSVHGTHQDLSLLFVPPVRSGGTEIKMQEGRTRRVLE